jgi:hypothetical protein
VSAGGDADCLVEFSNRQSRDARFDLAFRRGDLPASTRLQVCFERLPDASPAVQARPDDLKRYGIVVLRPREPSLPRTRRDRRGGLRHFDVERVYTFSAARDTIIRAVRIPTGRSLLLAIHLVVPEDAAADTLRFKVVQQVGRQIVDGITCVAQLRRPTTPPTA